MFPYENSRNVWADEIEWKRVNKRYTQLNCEIIPFHFIWFGKKPIQFLLQIFAVEIQVMSTLTLTHTYKSTPRSGSHNWQSCENTDTFDKWIVIRILIECCVRVCVCNFSRLYLFNRCPAFPHLIVIFYVHSVRWHLYMQCNFFPVFLLLQCESVIFILFSLCMSLLISIKHVQERTEIKFSTIPLNYLMR